VNTFDLLLGPHLGLTTSLRFLLHVSFCGAARVPGVRLTADVPSASRRIALALHRFRESRSVN